MDESEAIGISIQELRLRFAVNSFKNSVLGDKHVAREHQTETLIGALPKSYQELSLFDKTWSRWFSNGGTIPRRANIELLDKIALSLTGEAEKPGKAKSRNSLTEMVYGGLVSELVKPTKSNNRLHTLIGRANDYEAASAFHLHLDAIEAAGWHDKCHDLEWYFVTEVAGKRVLELLNERWSPRYGILYNQFESNFAVKWNKADAEEKQEMLKPLEGFKPNLFEYFMRKGAHPDWSATGFGSDISSEHIYKLLFCLAADPAFLIEERLQAWAIDLASAALAMHAIAWIDRYETMGIQPSDELFYWAAFDEIFFREDPLEADGWFVELTMKRSSATWHSSSFSLFIRAREIYHQQLERYGLTPAEISAIVQRTRNKHGLVYQG